MAIGVVQNGTLGRIYKSAPTVCINWMARSGWGRADTIRSDGLRDYVARSSWLV